MKNTKKVPYLEAMLKGLTADERILLLGQCLFDEVESQGYSTKGSGCKHIDIWTFTSDNSLRIQNINNGWLVDGDYNV